MLGHPGNLLFKLAYLDNIPACHSRIHGFFFFPIPKLSSAVSIIKGLWVIGTAHVLWKDGKKLSQQTWAFVMVCMRHCWWERQIKLLLLVFNPCHFCAADHELSVSVNRVTLSVQHCWCALFPLELNAESTLWSASSKIRFLHLVLVSLIIFPSVSNGSFII